MADGRRMARVGDVGDVAKVRRHLWRDGPSQDHVLGMHRGPCLNLESNSNILFVHSAFQHLEVGFVQVEHWNHTKSSPCIFLSVITLKNEECIAIGLAKALRKYNCQALWMDRGSVPCDRGQVAIDPSLAPWNLFGH